MKTVFGLLLLPVVLVLAPIILIGLCLIIPFTKHEVSDWKRFV